MLVQSYPTDFNKGISKMYVDMWMDLLKQWPLDENYRHLTMQGLVGLLKVY